MSSYTPKLTHRSKSTFLPLWSRAIFVDWHGVLSMDHFWASALKNSRHRFHHQVKSLSFRVFEDVTLTKAWMKGELTSEDILLNFGLSYQERLHLRGLLRRDCRKMNCNQELLSELKLLASRGFLIVMATDNMDCFQQEIDFIPGIASVFDAVLCSSELGVLKGEDPQRFFGTWLQVNGIRPENAFLLDDSPSNVTAFRSIGGESAMVSAGNSAVNLIRSRFGIR